jgi:WD40 repeat protein
MMGIMATRRWASGLTFLAVALPLAAAEPPADGPLARLGVPRLQIGYPLAFAADGKSFLGISPAGDLIRHDAATGAVIERIQLPGENESPSLSGDGSVCLVASRQREFSVWDVSAKRRLLHVPMRDKDFGVVLAADGKTAVVRVFSDDKYSLAVWDVATGRERIFAGKQDRKQGGHFVISPDGKRLIAQGPELRCWDVANGQVVWTARKPWNPEKWTFSPDGKTLLLIDNSRWRVLNAETGEPLDDWKLPADQAYSLPALAPDNRTLVHPTKKGVVLWDLAEGRARHVLPGTSRETAAGWHHVGGFAPDGKSVLTNFGMVQRWDLETGRPMLPDSADRGHLTPAVTLAFSPDCKRLASGAHEDRSVRVWNVASARLLHTLRGHSSYIRTVLFTPDGKRLISGGGDSTVRIWDPAAGRELNVLRLHDPKDPGKHEQVGTMRLLPDGQRLAVASLLAFGPDEQATALSVWDLRDGKRLESWPNPFGHKPRAWDLGVINRYLTADGLAMFTDRGQLLAIDGTLLRPDIQQTADEHAYDPVLAADDRLVASQKYHNEPPAEVRGVDVWELATGHRIARLSGDAHRVAFSPRAPFVVTAGHDGLRVCDMTTGKVVRSFVVRCRQDSWWCNTIAISADGHLAATSMRDGTIWLWDISLPPTSPAPLTEAMLARAWEDLADADAAKGYAAAVRLTSAPGPAAALLGAKLRPAEPVAAERVKALIADLASPQFVTRQAAERELIALGDRVAGPLRAAVAESSSAETRKRIEAILAPLADSAVPPNETLRGIRAVAVLERIGTPEARRLLEKLAGGLNTARLTREAKSSLAAWPTRP